jgi:hypothetical protein
MLMPSIFGSNLRPPASSMPLSSQPLQVERHPKLHAVSMCVLEPVCVSAQAGLVSSCLQCGLNEPQHFASIPCECGQVPKFLYCDL